MGAHGSFGTQTPAEAGNPAGRTGVSFGCIFRSSPPRVALRGGPRIPCCRAGPARVHSRRDTDRPQHCRGRRADRRPWQVVGWALFLGMSWTWCIGMFMPVLMVREWGFWGWVVFTAPNVVGAAAMGWVLRDAAASRRLVGDHLTACSAFSAVTIIFQLSFAGWIVVALVGHWGGIVLLGVMLAASIGERLAGAASSSRPRRSSPLRPSCSRWPCGGGATRPPPASRRSTPGRRSTSSGSHPAASSASCSARTSTSRSTAPARPPHPAPGRRRSHSASPGRSCSCSSSRSGTPACSIRFHAGRRRGRSPPASAG